MPGVHRKKWWIEGGEEKGPEWYILYGERGLTEKHSGGRRGHAMVDGKRGWSGQGMAYGKR